MFLIDVDVLNLDIKATPLHAAARMNSVNVAHVLLARCADIDRKTSTGLTPLHISARRGHKEMTNVRIGVMIIRGVEKLLRYWLLLY